MKSIVLYAAGLSAVGVIAAVAYVSVAKKTPGNGVLHLACWSGYSNPGLFARFSKETGIKIVEENYTSNEELQSKLEAGKGAGHYDVICPTDYTVPQLVTKGLLLELDHRLLPNLRNMSGTFMDKGFDKGNKHSVPYFWGTTGIGYNKKLVSETVDSLAFLFDEAKLKTYAGKISMLDHSREALALGMKYLGNSLNSQDPAHIEAAKQLLIKQKKYIGRYDISAAADLVAAGELAIAHYYSGDVLRARRKNPDVAYAFPKEGGFIWMDNLAIASVVENKEAAYAFLDYTMRAEESAAMVRHTNFPTANQAALAHLSELRDDTSLFPLPETLARAEWVEPMPKETLDLLERAWQEVKNYKE